jgi:pyroglutamyl-peptidase
MAGGRNFYTVETRAHRDSYKLRDVDGNDMEDDTVWRDKYKSPEILYSDLDAGGDVYDRWRQYMKLLDRHADVRVSDDAGRYLCDFIYYTSLVEFWRQEKDMKVLFVHVPGDTDDAAIDRGRAVIVGLVWAMVESWMEEEALVDRLERRQERRLIQGSW